MPWVGTGMALLTLCSLPLKVINVQCCVQCCVPLKVMNERLGPDASSVCWTTAWRLDIAASEMAQHAHAFHPNKQS
jgi:hypothetical protein